MPTIVSCPTCQTSVEWREESRYRPFCSQRCLLIDLGEWFGEARRIPGEAASGEESSDDGTSA